MPILNSQVVDGPHVQVGGQHRGIIEYVFSDGRIIRKTVRTPDIISWLAAEQDYSVKLEEQIAEFDAEEAYESGQLIAAYKEGKEQRIAVIYLRKAYSTLDPYQAYLLFDKFNSYRLTKGWTLNQVVSNLTAAGLTLEEWTDMKARYSYLLDASVVVNMVAYQTVLTGDVWGNT